MQRAGMRGRVLREEWPVQEREVYPYMIRINFPNVQIMKTHVFFNKKKIMNSQKDKRSVEAYL